MNKIRLPQQKIATEVKQENTVTYTMQYEYNI